MIIFGFVFSLLSFIPISAASQTLSDYCHVYIIDVNTAQQAAAKYPTGDTQQDAKLLAAGVIILGRFSPKIAEEELTTQIYPLPKTNQVITVSVYYTDESMFSTRLKTAESMLVGIIIAKKAYKDALSGQNSVISEVSYGRDIDTVRTKTYVQIQGRPYLVGIECRCQREFDETEQKPKE